MLQRDAQIACLVERLGDDPREIADGAREAVQLVDQMLGERSGGILEAVEIERFLAAA